MFFYLLVSLTTFAISLFLAKSFRSLPFNVKFLNLTLAILGAITSLLTAYAESLFVFYNVTWFIALFSGFAFADMVCKSRMPKLMLTLCLICGFAFAAALTFAVISYIKMVKFG